MTDDVPDPDRTGSDDGRVVARESAPEPDGDVDGPPEGTDPFENYPVDPVGTGLAVLILLVGVTLLFLGPLSGVLDPGPSPPQAEWTYERVNDTHVQVAHLRGEEARASRLRLTVDGTERSVDWPETVSSGTVVLVRADPGSTVEVVWVGDGREILARFTV